MTRHKKANSLCVSNVQLVLDENFVADGFENDYEREQEYLVVPASGVPKRKRKSRLPGRQTPRKNRLPGRNAGGRGNKCLARSISREQLDDIDVGQVALHPISPSKTRWFKRQPSKQTGTHLQVSTLPIAGFSPSTSPSQANQSFTPSSSLPSSMVNTNLRFDLTAPSMTPSDSFETQLPEIPVVSQPSLAEEISPDFSNAEFLFPDFVPKVSDASSSFVDISDSRILADLNEFAFDMSEDFSERTAATQRTVSDASSSFVDISDSRILADLERILQVADMNAVIEFPLAAIPEASYATVSVSSEEILPPLPPEDDDDDEDSSVSPPPVVYKRFPRPDVHFASRMPLVTAKRFPSTRQPLLSAPIVTSPSMEKAVSQATIAMPDPFQLDSDTETETESEEFIDEGVRDNETSGYDIMLGPVPSPRLRHNSNHNAPNRRQPFTAAATGSGVEGSRRMSDFSLRMTPKHRPNRFTSDLRLKSAPEISPPKIHQEPLRRLSGPVRSSASFKEPLRRLSGHFASPSRRHSQPSSKSSTDSRGRTTSTHSAEGSSFSPLSNKTPSSSHRTSLEGYRFFPLDGLDDNDSGESDHDHGGADITPDAPDIIISPLLHQKDHVQWETSRCSGMLVLWTGTTWRECWGVLSRTHLVLYDTKDCKTIVSSFKLEGISDVSFSKTNELILRISGKNDHYFADRFISKNAHFLSSNHQLVLKTGRGNSSEYWYNCIQPLISCNHFNVREPGSKSPPLSVSKPHRRESSPTPSPEFQPGAGEEEKQQEVELALWETDFEFGLLEECFSSFRNSVNVDDFELIGKSTGLALHVDCRHLFTAFDVKNQGYLVWHKVRQLFQTLSAQQRLLERPFNCADILQKFISDSEQQRIYLNYQRRAICIKGLIPEIQDDDYWLNKIEDAFGDYDSTYFPLVKEVTGDHVEFVFQEDLSDAMLQDLADLVKKIIIEQPQQSPQSVRLEFLSFQDFFDNWEHNQHYFLQGVTE